MFVDSDAAIFGYLIRKLPGFADAIILFTDDIHEFVHLLILFIWVIRCGFRLIGCAVGCSDDWVIIKNDIRIFALI